MGNDLITPHIPYFPGLKAGDNWCLCVFRWVQAKIAGKQPRVVLEATNKVALDYLNKYNLTINDFN